MLHGSPPQMNERILATPQKWFWIPTLPRTPFVVVLPLWHMNDKHVLHLPTKFCLSFNFIFTVAFFSLCLLFWFVDMKYFREAVVGWINTHCIESSGNVIKHWPKQVTLPVPIDYLDNKVQLLLWATYKCTLC